MLVALLATVMPVAAGLQAGLGAFWKSPLWNSTQACSTAASLGSGSAVAGMQPGPVLFQAGGIKRVVACVGEKQSIWPWCVSLN